MIVILYVDDIAVGSNSASEIDQLFQNLFDRFTIKRLGPIDQSFYLGMLLTLSEDGSSITMSQPHTITKLLVKLKMESCRPVSTPQNTKTSLTADNGTPSANPTLFRSIIGVLFWIARTTRPDIMFTVSVLAQY
ncbi:MAG TPA: reverse transcriptase domain-containing protein, partial [Terriglobia bacterium]|nr:reverse transcriptase domain-containing protein [Terriglobia bacterium]